MASFSESPLRKRTLSEDECRVIIQSPRPEYRRVTQRYNLPTRAIPLVRPHQDVIVLPGSYEPLHDFFEFVKEVKGLDEDQVIYTEGLRFVLDEEITDDIIDRLVDFVKVRTSDGSRVCAIYPYSVTDGFSSWFDRFRQRYSGEIRVFGDDNSWVKMYGHKGVLHRRIDSPDIPCLAEMIPSLRPPRGFTCSTPTELAEAFNLLGRIPVVVKPVLGAAGEGILFIEEEGELLNYDFPMGDVVIEEKLNLDRAEDGIILAPATHYVGAEMCGDMVDQIMISTTYAGWRETNVSAEFREDAIRQTFDFIRAIQPCGPGGFDFLSVDGIPYITDVNTGRMNGAHFPKLLLEQFAHGKRFYCWKFKPKKGMDVWMFWNKVLEAEIEFIPGISERGVFPITFLKGLSGQFIAIGRDEAELKDLYQKADAILRTQVITIEDVTSETYARLRKEEFGRIWCQSPFKNQRKEWHRLVIPCRPLCLMRPNIDLIVLPGGDEHVRSFWQWNATVLGLDVDRQAIFTSARSHVLDADINNDEDVLTSIKSWIVPLDPSSPSRDFTLIPNTVTAAFLKWATKLERLGAHMFGDSMEFLDSFGGKAFLHPHASEPHTPSPLRRLLEMYAEQNGQPVSRVRVPKGYVCDSVEDLETAYKLINTKEVVLKPVDCEDGEGIIFVADPAELQFYDFPYGQIVMEERLSIDRDSNGVVVSPAVYFLENDPVEGITTQVILGRRAVGLRKFSGKKTLRESIRSSAKLIIQATDARGPGGLDFVLSNGKEYLIDNNFGRFNQAHFVRLFKKKYSPESAHYLVWNFVPRTDIFSFWDELLRVGIGFRPGVERKGVYPLLFLPDLAGTFVAFGETEAEIRDMQSSVLEILQSQFVRCAHNLTTSTSFSSPLLFSLSSSSLNDALPRVSSLELDSTVCTDPSAASKASSLRFPVISSSELKNENEREEQ